MRPVSRSSREPVARRPRAGRQAPRVPGPIASIQCTGLDGAPPAPSRRDRWRQLRSRGIGHPPVWTLRDPPFLRKLRLVREESREETTRLGLGRFDQRRDDDRRRPSATRATPRASPGGSPPGSAPRTRLRPGPAPSRRLWRSRSGLGRSARRAYRRATNFREDLSTTN